MKNERDEKLHVMSSRYKNKVKYWIYKVSRNAINVGFIDMGTVVELLVGLPVDKITVTPRYSVNIFHAGFQF